jgi:serine protease inhibitor
MLSNQTVKLSSNRNSTSKRLQVESALLDEENLVTRALDFHDRSRTLVRLPKFRIESSHDLKPALQALGLGTIFSAETDFSGISGRTGLVVDQVRRNGLCQKKD